MTITKLLEEYFRETPNPRCIEVESKYPNLYSNPAIRKRLWEKYPPSRKTDKEYRNMWIRAFTS